MSEEAKEQVVREHGTVKFFNGTFGFICRNGDRHDSIFCHFKNIDMPGFRALKQDEAVSFEVEVTERGPQAIHVIPERLAQASTK